jgi:hypothetical protein
VDVAEQQARDSMRTSETPDWLIDTLLELFRISKAGYVAAVSPVVEELLKRKSISFDQFLRDHAQEFSGTTRSHPEAKGASRT